MEEQAINPAFLGVLGVLIGSGLTLLGNVLNQYFISKKEELHWFNQRKADKEDNEEARKKEEKEYVTNLYHKSIHSLSVVSSYERQHESSDKSIPSKLINDAHEWLALLSLKCSDEESLKKIDDFLESPNLYRTEILRKHIFQLVKNEELLFETNEIIVADTNDNRMKLSFNINMDFQEQMLIEGIQLPNSAIVCYEFEELTNEHRNRLSAIYFLEHRKIPENATLYIPFYKQRNSKINYKGKVWEAELIPDESTFMEIMAAWGTDFDEAQKIAQNNMELSDKL